MCHMCDSKEDLVSYFLFHMASYLIRAMQLICWLKNVHLVGTSAVHCSLM